MTVRRREPPGGWGAHDALVASIAARYYRALGGQGSSPGAVEWIDLMQVGRMGMIRAAERWDPERGAWSTYSTRWIRHTIARYCENHARMVRIPVHAQRTLRSAGALKPEAATRLALDAPIAANDNGESRPFHDRVPDPGWVHPLAGIEARQASGAVRAALAQLPERLRQVIVMRFFDGKVLKDVGAALGGLSRERARQLEAEALAELRKLLRRAGRREAA